MICSFFVVFHYEASSTFLSNDMTSYLSILCFPMSYPSFHSAQDHTLTLTPTINPLLPLLFPAIKHHLPQQPMRLSYPFCHGFPCPQAFSKSFSTTALPHQQPPPASALCFSAITYPLSWNDTYPKIGCNNPIQLQYTTTALFSTASIADHLHKPNQFLLLHVHHAFGMLENSLPIT